MIEKVSAYIHLYELEHILGNRRIPLIPYSMSCRSELAEMSAEEIKFISKDFSTLDIDNYRKKLAKIVQFYEKWDQILLNTKEMNAPARQQLEYEMRTEFSEIHNCDVLHKKKLELESRSGDSSNKSKELTQTEIAEKQRINETRSEELNSTRRRKATPEPFATKKVKSDDENNNIPISNLEGTNEAQTVITPLELEIKTAVDTIINKLRDITSPQNG